MCRCLCASDATGVVIQGRGAGVDPGLLCRSWVLVELLVLNLLNLGAGRRLRSDGHSDRFGGDG